MYIMLVCDVCCVFERICKALYTRMLVSFCCVQLINMSNLAVKFYKLPDKMLISYSTVNCVWNLNECCCFLEGCGIQKQRQFHFNGQNLCLMKMNE